MDLRQQRVLQSHRRALVWCAANPGLVPAPEGTPDAWAPITRQLHAVNKTVTDATAAATQQGVSGTQVKLEATDELALRKHLRDEMRAVTQVAQALRKTVPGIGLLKMPPPRGQAESLVKAANAFITQASTYEMVLVEHALPSDFLEQLRSAMSALKVSIDGRGAARADQVGATKQLAVSLSLGKQVVQILDSALTKALRTDPAKLAEWKNVKRTTIKGVSNTGTIAAPAFATPVTSVTPITSPPTTVPVSVPEPTTKAA